MRRFLLAGLAMMVAACATAPRLEAPRIGVSAVRVENLTGLDARFTIMVNLTNPNDRDIAINAIDAELRIENIAVGTAHLFAPVRLPARGEATAAIAARADLSASLRATAEMAQRLAEGGATPPSVRYVISGVATLEGGSQVPFSRNGEFKLTRAGDTP